MQHTTKNQNGKNLVLARVWSQGLLSCDSFLAANEAVSVCRLPLCRYFLTFITGRVGKWRCVQRHVLKIHYCVNCSKICYSRAVEFSAAIKSEVISVHTDAFP